MKIALVTPSYPPYRGGMGNVAFHFTKQLRRLGHKVEVFTPKYAHMPSEMDDNEVTLLKPFAKYGNAAYVPQLAWKLRGYDVIYAHIPFIGAVRGLILFKLSHPTVKLVVHYQMDLIGSGFTRILFWLYSQTYLRMLLRIADTIIVSSKDYVRFSQISSSFNNSRTVVVANGITYDLFSKSSVPQVANLKPYILFVGGLDKAHHFKGVSLLIKAWQKVHKAHPEAHLVILGNGGERMRYENEAKRGEAASSIHFRSNIDDEAIVGFYKHAHVTVLPSTTSGEAFGLVLLESMAAGTPVVVSNLPGVRTLVREGNGWRVEPSSEKELREALIAALSTDTDRMRETVQTFAKEFDWEKLAIPLEKALQK